MDILVKMLEVLCSGIYVCANFRNYLNYMSQMKDKEMIYDCTNINSKQIFKLKKNSIRKAVRIFMDYRSLKNIQIYRLANEDSCRGIKSKLLSVY